MKYRVKLVIAAIFKGLILLFEEGLVAMVVVLHRCNEMIEMTGV